MDIINCNCYLRGSRPSSGPSKTIGRGSGEGKGEKGTEQELGEFCSGTKAQSRSRKPRELPQGGEPAVVGFAPGGGDPVCSGLQGQTTSEQEGGGRHCG